ncbi:DUF262 domain-containing protein [Amycolatopsis japonica]|uniref:DUF262 domain-containing protein n=1 Tax=Amycolatopsis japonica TaxID=208439 RepID=UPI00366ECFF0
MSKDVSAASADTEEETADLTAEEVAALNEAESDAEPVIYSGTDFDIEGLVRRLTRGDIVVPSFGHNDPTLETAGFQRDFVWRRPQMDRFIESLLLGYPIPGIIFVQQQDRRYLVLDGQQRLRTLAAFYDGVHAGREFALQNVADEYKGVTYKTLAPERRRQLDNTFIQATIVKTDGSLASLEAIYQVFERLNSGGTQLTPHEIRVALYPGPLVGFLSRLNESASWRALYGTKSPRLRDQELILRILALFVSGEDYFRPLKKYLNDFLGTHRHLEDISTADFTELFEKSSKVLFRAAGRYALRYQSGQVNAALAEALFVGLMRRMERDREIAVEDVARTLKRLVSNPELTSSISGSTATEEYVRKRLAVATAAFESI